MSSKLTIYYPYHPYYEQELEIVTRPQKPDGCFVVRDPAGKDLAVPQWMTEPIFHYGTSGMPKFPLRKLRALCRTIDSIRDTDTFENPAIMKEDACVSTKTISRKSKRDRMSQRTHCTERGDRIDGRDDHSGTKIRQRKTQ
jgi:hypothetical protein